MSVEIMNRMRDNFKCPECNGDIIARPAEIYCTKCGLVIDDSPVDDNDSEANAEGEYSKTRTGPPLKYWEIPSSII